MFHLENTMEMGQINFAQSNERKTRLSNRRMDFFCPSYSVADPGSGQGGRRFFPRSSRQSEAERASKASQYWPVSRACFRVLEALAF